MNLVAQIWKGEVSLWKNFWFVGILGCAAVSYPMRIAAEKVAAGDASYTNQFYVSIVAAIAYTCFAAVSGWRSANRYEGHVAWKYLAKAWVLLQAYEIIKSVIYFAQTYLTA